MGEVDTSAPPSRASTPPAAEEPPDDFRAALERELELFRRRLLAAHAASAEQRLATWPVPGTPAPACEKLAAEPEAQQLPLQVHVVPACPSATSSRRPSATSGASEPASFGAGARVCGASEQELETAVRRATKDSTSRGSLLVPTFSSQLSSSSRRSLEQPRRNRGSMGSSTTASTELPEDHRILVDTRETPSSFLLHRTFLAGRSHGSMMLPAQLEDDDCEVKSFFGDSLRSEERCSRLVISPGAGRRIAWDCAGILFVAYDVVMVPLAVFGFPPDVGWAILVSNLSTLFWTFDLVLSFLTGFDGDTGTEMRPSRIAQNYAKSWLVPDATVVAVDWILILFAPDSSDVAGLLRLGRQARALRILRAVKLVRMMKVVHTLRKVLDGVQSGYALVIAQIFELLLCIMLINHYIACGWYGLCDRQHFALGKASTWRESYGTVGKSLLYEYATSLHWAMTQFTPASMDVFPTNDAERLYNIFVLLLGLVMFSSFVSSITSLITQLRSLRSERVREEARLRDFLHQSKVSMKLGVRIKAICRKKHHTPHRRLYERDVPALAELPTGLRAEMRREIFGPALLHHPVFELLALVDSAVVTFICDKALTWARTSPGASLFDVGDLASAMFVVAQGSFDYAVGVRGPTVQLVPTISDSPRCRPQRRVSQETCSTSSTEATKSETSSVPMGHATSLRHQRRGVEERTESSATLQASHHGVKLRVGDCICEPALWGNYVCCGRAVAAGAAETARVCAERFRAVVAQCPDAMALLRPYATLTAAELNEIAEDSDHDHENTNWDLGLGRARVRALTRQAAELSAHRGSVAPSCRPRRLSGGFGESFLQARFTGLRRMGLEAGSSLSQVAPEQSFDDLGGFGRRESPGARLRPLQGILTRLGL